MKVEPIVACESMRSLIDGRKNVAYQCYNQCYNPLRICSMLRKELLPRYLKTPAS